MIYALIIGAIAGWLAGKLMKGGGFGLILNIVIGIIGGIVGNWIFSTLGIILMSGLIGDVLTGVIGACAVLFVASLFKK